MTVHDMTAILNCRRSIPVLPLSLSSSTAAIDSTGSGFRIDTGAVVGDKVESLDNNDDNAMATLHSSSFS